MLVIFDWDGTLCDSTTKIVQCMQVAAKEVGLEVLDDEKIRNIIGLGLREALLDLYPGISEGQVLALRDAYATHYLHRDQTPSPYFHGVEETLTHLRDEGYALAIATGKSRAGLDRVLQSMGLVGFFHGSRCADETASKPDPRMLAELAAEFDRPAAEAVMVGDTEYDMEMARRFDMPRIAVSYGAHHIDRLRPYEPALCIDQFDSILSYFSR